MFKTKIFISTAVLIAATGFSQIKSSAFGHEQPYVGRTITGTAK
jgi:hypothetical protein